MQMEDEIQQWHQEVELQKCSVSTDLILTGKAFSLKLKGKLYTSCVRSCLLYGTENWPMKNVHEVRVRQNWNEYAYTVCSIKLKQMKRSAEIRELLGTVPVSLVIMNGRFRRLGHVESKADADWIKCCMSMKLME